MEFRALNEFISEGAILQKGDYLYKHDKEGYPLQKEVDISNLYLVDENTGSCLIVRCFANNPSEVHLNDAYWWILRLPEGFFKQFKIE